MHGLIQHSTGALAQAPRLSGGLGDMGGGGVRGLERELISQKPSLKCVGLHHIAIFKPREITLCGLRRWHGGILPIECIQKTRNQDLWSFVVAYQCHLTWRMTIMTNGSLGFNF